MSKKATGRFHATEDHIYPKSKGGSDLIGNLVGACFTCNNMRGTIEYWAFKQFIQLHGNRRSISDVLRSLTREEYELHQEMYDAVRDSRHATHLPEKERPILPPFILAPEQYRRTILRTVRRTLQSIILSIPEEKRNQILQEGENGR